MCATHARAAFIHLMNFSVKIIIIIIIVAAAPCRVCVGVCHIFGGAVYSNIFYTHIHVRLVYRVVIYAWRYFTSTKHTCT